MQVLILGAGPAGLTVAETLRERDRSTAITMLSSEPYAPYAPPAMADHFITGSDETLFWKGHDVCERLGVDYRPSSSVARVEPRTRTVVLEGGTALGYDRLVLATGSRLHAPVQGSTLAGISNFKSLRAAESLVQRARHGEARSAVVVGAGFIGVEVALLLAELGLRVTMVEALDRVMHRMLDGETAAIVQAELIRRGIELRLATPVAAFAGDGSVEHVELESGERLRADVYVAATGVKPNVELLAQTEIATRWGVMVDDHLRTNVADVYAVGDVAETVDRLTGERYVHAIFPNAVEQGRVAAMNLLGDDLRYEGSESMNSQKHVGVPLIAVGALTGDDELRWSDGAVLRKVYLTGGRIVGFRLAGDIRAAGVYRSLMLRRENVTRFGRGLVDPWFGAGEIALSARASVDDLRSAQDRRSALAG